VHLPSEKAFVSAKLYLNVQAEFRAEQEYLQTLSFLGPEEQTKFKERQGVQFMYMKPPGMDALAAAAVPASEVTALFSCV